MTIHNAVEMYLDSCAASGKSRETIGSYRRTLVKLIEYMMMEHKICDLESILPVHVDGFKCARAGEVSATSLNLYLAHLRVFFSWCTEMRIIPENPFNGHIKVERSALRAKRSQPYDHVLTEAQFCQILYNDHPANMHRSAYAFNRALLVLLITTGMRISALADLRLDDLDWTGSTIYVRETKGGKSGVVPFVDVAKEAVAAYLASGSRPESAEPSDPLFCATEGALGQFMPCTRESLSLRVERAVKGFCGVSGFHAHAMRHTCASLLANRGVPDRDISVLLMHTSSGEGAAVTSRYINRDLSPIFNRVNITFCDIANNCKN